MCSWTVSSRRRVWALGLSCVYLPLPVLLDISLSFWSVLLQLNVTLSSSTLSQLKCFYSQSCQVWHECAPECTVDRTLQENSAVWNWLLVLCDASELVSEQTLSWCSQWLCRYSILSSNQLHMPVFQVKTGKKYYDLIISVCKTGEIFFPFGPTQMAAPVIHKICLH